MWQNYIRNPSWNFKALFGFRFETEKNSPCNLVRATKKLGWSLILPWVLNSERMQKMSLRRISINSWIILYSARRWKTSENVLTLDLLQMKCLQKSWLQNQIMSARLYLMNAFLQYIWKNITCFQQASLPCDVNFRFEQNFDVWLSLQLYEREIWQIV